MSKFYVGQKVLVTGSTFIPVYTTRDMIGTICEVKDLHTSKGVTAIWNADKSDWGNFNDGDFQPLTETPETLTINGVEYIRKPEPVVEHEWKFGDVATHEEYGVGIVTRLVDIDGDMYFDCAGDDKVGNGNFVNPSSLTFIRRADLSV